MSSLPFGVQAYRRADLPPLRLLNLFAEKTPSTKGAVTLLPRPALSEFFMAGGGPIWGILRQPGALNDTTMVVSDQSLYNGSIYIGPLPNNGIVNIAGTSGAFLIATGIALYWTDGGSVTQVTFPDDQGVSAVAFIGGYALAVATGTRRLYYTLDPLTWDGLDYLSAEQSTGDIKALSIVNDQLWVFCEQVTEIMILTGNAEAPFAPLQGRTLTKGCLSRDTVVQADNTVFWVADDGIVCRGGDAPLRVSDHSVEQDIAASTSLNAWTFTWVGHEFYVLNTDLRTWALDLSTNLWAEFGSFGEDGWRGWMGFTLDASLTYVGDRETGNVWRLVGDTFVEGGEPIQTIFPALVNDRGYLDNIGLEISAGETADPNDPAGIVEMRMSRDGGSSWTAWRQASLGATGKYRTLPNFRRNGLVDLGNAILEFRITSNVPRRVSEIYLNESMGGRSR